MTFKESIVEFRKMLAEWIYPVDPVGLTRSLLHGIGVGAVNIDSLPLEKREEMIANAHNVFMNPSFPFVIDYLISMQSDEVIKRAPNMDSILFGRGSINGQSLVKEEFERLSSLHKEIIDSKRTAKFDKFSVV